MTTLDIHAKRWSTLFALLGLAGCEGALQSASMGRVGCPSDEIAISNDSIGWRQRTWDASCRGHVFHCSAEGGSKYVSSTIACTEDLSDSPPTAPPPIVAPLVTAPPEHGEREHRWREVSPPECGVTALMPGTPIEERREEKTLVGAVPVYTVHGGTPDATAVLACFAIPGTAAIQVAKAFDRAGAEMLKGMQATLRAETDWTLDDDVPARDVDFTFKNQTKGRARLLFVGRTVAIAIMAPLEGFSDAETRAFFAALAPARDDD